MTEFTEKFARRDPQLGVCLWAVWEFLRDPLGLTDRMGAQSIYPSLGLSFQTATMLRATILFWQRVCRRDHGVGL